MRRTQSEISSARARGGAATGIAMLGTKLEEFAGQKRYRRRPRFHTDRLTLQDRYEPYTLAQLFAMERWSSTRRR